MKLRKYLLLLSLAGLGFPLLGAQGEPLRLGEDKHLFLDRRLIESSKGVRLVFNPPEQPRENLILKDRPWEQGRVGGYAHVLKDGELYRMYYNSFDRSYQIRYLCLALSSDGVRWTKPDLDLIEYQGIRKTNIVAIDAFGSPFIDPFDTPEKRYKLYSRVGRAPGERDQITGSRSTSSEVQWPAFKGADPSAVYLLYSRDGVRWKREAEPVMPYYVGAPTSVLWNDSIERWAIYPRAYLPQSQVRVYARTTARKYELAKRFDLEPSSHRNQMQESGFSLGGLLDELPVVLKPDRQDPDGMQVYTLYAYNYPAADAYVAFPSMWYSRRPDDFGREDPGAADALEIQFAYSRDGIEWQRPFRKPLVSLGTPGSGFEGQIYGAGLVKSGDQLFLYYNGLPSDHMTRDKSVDWTCITARAIFRLDGFVSADADYAGGELTTPLLTFSGSRLRYNAKTGGGGYIRTEILDESGKPIPGFTLAAADRINGNSVHHVVSWRGKDEAGAVAGRKIKLRLVMRDVKLYSLQFLP